MTPTRGGHRHVVPLTMGSPSYRCVELDGAGIRVTEALFPAATALPMHAHERTIVAVMLGGGFDLVFRSRRFDCPTGMVSVEPAGEPHANRIGADGARPLVLEIAPEALAESFRPCARVLSGPAAFRRDGVSGIGRRLQRELRRSDASSRLALETLVFELLAAIGGRTERDHDARVRAGWVEMVRDLIHAHLDRPLRVTDLAEAAGVHRVHLGRVFRAQFGESIGDYHRRLRIEWAARELAREGVRVSDVALRAGFADQSHFTRFFRQMMGVTPRAYRQQRRVAGLKEFETRLARP
jgi:AraC family transcriptional regulator